MGKELATTDQVLAEIAARQHGLLTASQLRDAGLGATGISRRVGRGKLHRIHRGVYALGHPHLGFEARCLAAALACRARRPPNRRSDSSAVSHASAAALWKLIPPPAGPIHISVRTTGGRAKRSGIVVHRPSSLSGADLTRRFGVPVTRPARTLRDLQVAGPPSLHRKATRRALDLGLVGERDLEGEPDLTRSELERLFLRLCRRRRLPMPEVNTRVAGYEVDFLWATPRVIAETDGFRHHSHREAFERDRARDAALQALGYRVLRFTYRQVQREPEEIAVRLRAVLG